MDALSEGPHHTSNYGSAAGRSVYEFACSPVYSFAYSSVYEFANSVYRFAHTCRKG